MNITLEDAQLAASTMRDSARATVKLALDRRTRRKKKRFDWFGRRLVLHAKQLGMAARRLQTEINDEIHRLTTQQ